MTKLSLDVFQNLVGRFDKEIEYQDIIFDWEFENDVRINQTESYVILENGSKEGLRYVASLDENEIIKEVHLLTIIK